MYFQGLNFCSNCIEEINYITQHVLTINVVFFFWSRQLQKENALKSELANLTFKLKNNNATVTFFPPP